MDEALLTRVARRLHSATRVFVITGAGVSAESGIPVFRGPGGLWRQHRPEELASPEGFRRDPKLVWEWYNERKRTVRAAPPNAAHDVIARWDARYPEFLLATQNVDGLHRRAGSKRFIELHGSILRSRCTETGRRFEDDEVDTESEVPPHSPVAPRALLRPDVVWYGEYLAPESIEQIDGFVERGALDLCFVIGTSAMLPYIVSWALAGKSHGAELVEVNPEPRLGEAADVVLEGRAAEILPRLDRLVQNPPAR